MSQEPQIYYHVRGQSQPQREIVYGGRLIQWAYGHERVPPLARLLFQTRWPSKLLGYYFDSPLSRWQVPRAIARLHIDEKEFLEPAASFRSFNAFFTRRLKPEARPTAADGRLLASPADGRLLAYPRLEAGSAVPVKGARFHVDELLGRRADQFHGGALCVIRLCPADYHRFHFPCAGSVQRYWTIPGSYHSVNPLALARGLNVFARNYRACTLLHSPEYGEYAYLEVGAFGVAGIVQTHAGGQVQRLAEKGFFKFGASTVILVFQPGRVVFSPDLVAHSAAGQETLVRMGETIGQPASPA